MKQKRSPLSILYSVLIFLFLYAPIVVLIVYSFNANKSRGLLGRLFAEVVPGAV